MAATRATSTSVDDHLSTLRDERLEVPAGAVAPMASAAGARPRSGMSGRSWLVAGRRVIGYDDPRRALLLPLRRLHGRLHREARALAATSRSTPWSTTGPASSASTASPTDGVVAVSVRVHGVTRRAAVGRNAFFLAAAGVRQPPQLRRYADRAITRRDDAHPAAPRRRVRLVHDQTTSRVARLEAGSEHGSLRAAVRGPVRRSGGAGPGASHPSGSAIVTQGLLAGVAQW